ncbi:T3SS effector NleG family protein, partial [Escherichia albertii]|nr:T3SS effector NleG family protein [Escherichia albertii]
HLLRIQLVHQYAAYFILMYFPRLSGEGSSHPLMRKSIITSMTVKYDECIFDSNRKNFCCKR